MQLPFARYSQFRGARSYEQTQRGEGAQSIYKPMNYIVLHGKRHVIYRHMMQTLGGMAMLFALGAVLLVLWVLGLAFHMLFSGLIHLLLVAAVILFVVHLLRRRGTV